jgi:protein-S-isoprenylcysteine O-methyltransferase Ste14
MTNNQIIAFIIGSVFIALFSWFVSIREKRYHGIPRFFAFEGLLLLGLLQQPIWFSDPFAPGQVVSWILLAICIYYIMAAVILYFRHARPGVNFENSTKLVTSGLYKFVRHPMYASLLLLGWGMFFKSIHPASIALILVITLALYLTCKVEEKEMMKRFGNEYRDYMKKTRLWIPFLI